MIQPVLNFRVLGVAVPFVRVSPGGKRGGVYEDRKYLHWKSQIIDAAMGEIKRGGWKTATCAVRVAMEFVLIRRPTKTVRPKHEWPIAGKSVGDIENYWKPVADAMQRAGVYRNDMLIVEIAAPTLKRWQAPREEFAGAIVRVEIVG